MRIQLLRRLTVCLVAMGVASLVSFSAADGPWQTPINLSQSGSATQPVVAVSSDGTVHIMWWDVFAGTQYAGMTASPTTMPQIVGERRVDARSGQTITQGAPRDLLLLGGHSLHALWQSADNQLLAAHKDGLGWSDAITLATSVPYKTATVDSDGLVHVAYVKSASPAGFYYQRNDGGEWQEPRLVYASPYARTMKADAMHMSIAARGDQVVVVWDDPLLEQSVLSRSVNGGKTWSAPVPLTGRSSLRIQKAQVAAANGEFLLIWQDAASGGCGLTQRRSTDGGETWSAAERILPTMTRCPVRWRFSLGNGRLWLIGLPAIDSENTPQVGTLAAWDGERWSEPVDVGLSFQNPATRRSVSLGSLDIAVGGTAAIVGRDDKGDVWATVAVVPLDQLVPALTPVWTSVQVLSDGRGQVELPAAAGDADGRLYVMWSQGPGKGETSAGLYLTVWDGTRWGRAARVFSTAANPAGIVAGQQLRAEHAALAVDLRGNLHAVWSGGTSGRIMYSWVFGRDALSPSAWAELQPIPAFSDIGGWPDIAADDRSGGLHVVYAIPYNERRGVYYVQSLPQGQVAATSWLTPTVVFDAVAAGWDAVGKPRLALDTASGAVHVAWLRSFAPGSVGIQSLYYSRSTDDGQTWNPSQKVIEGTIDWPRLVAAGGQVHLFWHRLRSDGSADVWHQYSTNGGEQWSQAAIVRGFDRLSGPVAIAADGAGTLHVLGMGLGQQGAAVLLRGLWDGSTWTRSETLALAQDPMAGNAVGAAVLGKGGRLIAVLRQWTLGADGNGQFQIAAMARTVDAAPTKPAPTFTPLPTPTPTVTPTPRPTVTVMRYIPQDAPPPPTPADQIAAQLPLALGGGLAIVLVLGALVTRGLWGSRR